MEFILAGLILLSVVVGFVFLLYWVPKKIGYPRVGKYLAGIVSSLLIILVIWIAFEDQFFSKKDAEKLLAEQDIRLSDDFKIIKNESMSGIGDYYHIFILTISQKDKKLIIEQIKKSNNFKNINENKADIFRSNNRYFGKKIIQNYEDEVQFVREYFKPSGKQNYAPTYRRIKVDKKDNRLTFEDID